MPRKNLKIGILGDGGWGTTLALLLAEKGHDVTLWGAFPRYVEEVEQKRENSKFLPGFKIPEEVKLSSDLHELCSHCEILVLATPSQFMRALLKKLKKEKPSGKLFVSVAKGIEVSSLKVMSQVVRDELGAVKFCVVSGPTIAREVAMRMPAAVSAASSDHRLAARVREIFSTDYFTLFESDDVIGVELGASVKNVIAISAGIVEGLGYGSNTRAVLLARGVAEMARLGQKMGARRETFMGLSGLGDLATTCLSPHSRNHWLGLQIGKGKKLKEILGQTEMVVEGVETCRAAHRLARKKGVHMPITDAVHEILFEGHEPRRVIEALMKSKLRRELD